MAMSNEIKSTDNLYTLISLEEFKALLNVDDREDKLARFSLVTSTFTIEQYCKRRLVRKKHFEQIEYIGDLILPLREYPVSEVLAVYTLGTRRPFSLNGSSGFYSAYAMSNLLNNTLTGSRAISGREQGLGTGEILETEFYRVIPDCGTDVDFPFEIEFSPAVVRLGCRLIKVIYWAGYSVETVPGDLAAACLELASWNMSRYRGRRVGLTGNVRGAGKEGEHFEMAMPENVRGLLESYKRKTI